MYINDFHRENSMAAQRAVKRMLLHPYSREQKIEQIQMLRRMSASSKAQKEVLSGKFLMETGIDANLSGQFASRVIRMKRR